MEEDEVRGEGMMYILFKCSPLEVDADCGNDLDVQCLNLRLSRLFIANEKFNIKIFLLRLYFLLITFYGVKLFYVMDGENVIHYSYVLSKCYKFPFMKTSDLEIGPCFTCKEYRGRGIYPRVLKKIISSGLNDSNFFMIVEESNLSSIKGVKKVGFKECGHVKKQMFKVYRKINECM